MGRLSRAHTAHVVYLKQKACLEDSDEDEGPQDEDGWLIEDLRVLAHLYSKMKDREQLISLIFEVFIVTFSFLKFPSIIHLGFHIGALEGHLDYLLLSSGSSLSCCQHCRFVKRSSEFHF